MSVTVYTVTCNPAVDYVVRLNRFEYAALNRCEEEEFQCGGKGINVSAILTALGIPNIALGFLGGFTGDLIEQTLAKKGISSDFVHLKNGVTRINVKIKDKKETEINAKGPQINAFEQKKMCVKLDAITSEDTVVISGSIPCGMQDTVYAEWTRQLSRRQIRVIVDAGGNLLKNALEFHPFLIKPNREELCDLLGRTLHSEKEIIQSARKLQECGAQNVLVSMGGDGALLLCENGECWRSEAVHGIVKNSVGAGDSMVAGFTAGYLQSGSMQQALLCGAAAGTATAFSWNLAEKQEIEQVQKLCQITKVSY